MTTMEELRVEGDRRRQELARASTEKADARYRIYEEINRRDAERKKREEEECQRAVLADTERVRLETEYAATYEGRVLLELQSIAHAVQSTADSARQIRNAIAFLLVLSTIFFLVSICFRGV